MKVLAYKSKLNVTNLPQQYGLPYKISMKSVGVGNVTTYDRNTLSTSTFRFSMQRNSIDLLLGSFFIPTGLFGFLSMASYIMNPVIVSSKIIILLYLLAGHIILNLLYRMGEWV